LYSSNTGNQKDCPPITSTETMEMIVWFQTSIVDPDDRDFDGRGFMATFQGNIAILMYLQDLQNYIIKLVLFIPLTGAQ